MPEQKIVQHRRDTYANFSPSKVKPGEIVMIQSGDPNSSSGKAVYACIAAGDVVRLATQDELSTYDNSARQAATDAAQAKADVVTLREQVGTVLNDAQSASQSAAAAQGAAEAAQAESAAQAAAAQASADAAASALESVQDKAEEVADILVRNSRTIETGSSRTDENGRMYVYLSDDFKDSLDGNPYSVFLQEEGEGKVFVDDKTDAFFVVAGTAGLAFSWMAII